MDEPLCDHCQCAVRAERKQELTRRGMVSCGSAPLDRGDRRRWIIPLVGWFLPGAVPGNQASKTKGENCTRH